MSFIYAYMALSAREFAESASDYATRRQQYERLARDYIRIYGGEWEPVYWGEDASRPNKATERRLREFWNDNATVSLKAGPWRAVALALMAMKRGPMEPFLPSYFRTHYDIEPHTKEARLPATWEGDDFFFTCYATHSIVAYPSENVSAALLSYQEGRPERYFSHE